MDWLLIALWFGAGLALGVTGTMFVAYTIVVHALRMALDVIEEEEAKDVL